MVLTGLAEAEANNILLPQARDFAGEKKLQEQSTEAHCWAGAAKVPEVAQDRDF